MVKKELRTLCRGIYISREHFRMMRDIGAGIENKIIHRKDSLLLL
jgi:hypothetical protein